MSLFTLLDVQRLRNNDVEVGVVQENLAAAPELSVIQTRTVPGNNYRTISVSGQSGGGFRAANEGVSLGKSTLEQKLHECFIYSHPLRIDNAVQAASSDGVADAKTLEMSQGVLTLMQKIGRQIFYGTAFDPKGFSGLKQFTPKTAVAGSSSIFVDATGSTAGAASSLYAIRMGIQDVHIILGGGTAFDFGPWIQQLLTDSSGSRYYMGAVAGLDALVGLQIARPTSAGRIANLTTQAGKGLTDALIAQLMSQFPTGAQPTHLFCSRRTAFQLASSRQKTIYYMMGNNAPGQTAAISDYTVRDYFGMPIIVTDQILDTDAIE